jgi:hypothetical protein
VFKQIYGHLNGKREVLGGDRVSLSAPVIPVIREISFVFFSGRYASKR